MSEAPGKALRRRSHYRAAFETPSGKEVLADLKRFCRHDRSTLAVGADGHVDTHAMAVAEGRREVFLRILKHVHIEDSQLLNLRETAYDD